MRKTNVDRYKFIEAENYKDSLKYYFATMNNYSLPFNEFLKQVSKQFGVEVSKEDIISKVKIINKGDSIRASEMLYALNYSIAMQKGNIDKIRECKEKLLEFDSIKKRRKESANFSIAATTKLEKMSAEKRDEIKNELYSVIENKKPSKDLHDSCAGGIRNLICNVKKILPELDHDDYVSFLFVNYGLKEFDEDDLKKDLEVITYFINSFKTKYDRLNSLDFNNHKHYERIVSEKVDSEDSMNVQTRNNIGRNYRWKLNRLKALYRAYNWLFESVNHVLSGSISSIEPIDSNTYRYIELEDISYFKELAMKIKETKTIYTKHVNDIITVGEEDKNDIEDKFIKKLVNR